VEFFEKSEFTPNPGAPAGQRGRFGNQFFQGDQFFNRRPSLGEGKQLPGQSLGLLAGLVCFSQAAAAPFSHLGVQHGQAEIACYRGQNIIEVVGNTTREYA
jgi:hypothetical protein